jgi:hypothetical protein
MAHSPLFIFLLMQLEQAQVAFSSGPTKITSISCGTFEARQPSDLTSQIPSIDFMAVRSFIGSSLQKSSGHRRGSDAGPESSDPLEAFQEDESEERQQEIEVFHGWLL